MQRFKNILVYTEGDSCSRAVLGRASALATMNKAHLIVLGVFESLPRELQAPGGGSRSGGVVGSGGKPG
jgi:nucleotide-binding universal stress UspA family protein